MNHTFPLLSSLLGSETLTIEYKQDNNQRRQGEGYPDDALAEALMSISNGEGGYLLLGVDNKGNITGLSLSRREPPHVLMNRLGRKFMRTPVMASHEYQEGSQRVYALYIEEAQPPPHQLQSGILKIRKDLGGKQGPENVPFPISEMSQWEAQRGMHTDFSSKLVRELPWRNYEQLLNPLAIGIFQRRIRDSQINNSNLRSLGGLEQQMDALGLIGTLDGQRVLTNAAIILFGSNEILRQYVPHHAAQFQSFAPDGSLPVSLFTGKPGFEHFCLLYLAERITELFRGVVPRGEMMDGPYRIDIPAYGDDALREATMNAFIHRDYTATEPVIIQVATDHFTITNAGGFYRDVKADNILFHEPCPRNKCLAQACADLGLMEKSGRGVDRIFWDQIRFLRPVPSYAASTSDTVRLTLLGGRGSLEDIHWMTEYFSAEDDLLTRVIKGSLMHALIIDGAATREELIASLPGLSPTLGRKTITELIDAGLMQRVGHGRGQQIVLSAQFQRDRGKPEAFIHQAGVDVEARPIIMKFIEAHGSITRGETATLLDRPSDDSLYRLLKRMVDDGLLLPEGERAATRYIKH